MIGARKKNDAQSEANDFREEGRPQKSFLEEMLKVFWDCAKDCRGKKCGTSIAAS